MESSPLIKLFSLHTLGIKLGLENIQNFLEYLGNPQLKLKSFHIAGSNGKGSTAAFISSILQEAGYKTGLYTSPHFIRFNERIKINGEEINDDYVNDFIIKNEQKIDELKLTFFEVTTAMAFKYFYDNQVDFAVVETGLGGRLDATNVMNSIAAVITSISLEHTNILGNTIEAITNEKAAIIKKKMKVFIGKIPDKAVKVIENKCIETNSELFCVEDYINEKADWLELYSEEIELDEWTMPLNGFYQKFNAALAGLTVSKTLDYNNHNIISAGIKNVIRNTGLQGRYEFYHKNPDIIFDSAHNPESIKSFLSEFSCYKENYSKKYLLFGVMRDKNVIEMLRILKDHFDEIFITEVNYERSLKIDELKVIADENNIVAKEEKKPAEFVKNFRNRKSGECLVVLGSMYLLGEIKTKLSINNFS